MEDGQISIRYVTFSLPAFLQRMSLSYEGEHAYEAPFILLINIIAIVLW